METPKGLVIVVTGSNSGVGFGICHRLLVQLSTGHPSDSKPYFDVSKPEHGAHEVAADEYAFSADAGVTIILACRSPARGQEAKTKLSRLLDEHISKLKRGSQEHEYASTFRRNVRLSVELLDLASIKSVLEFGQTVAKNYEYISHLILNAGTATYSHLDTLRFIVDLARYPMFGARNPRANLQVSGVMSQDNLGYVFQCNVFGHYVLYRSVQHLLIAYANVSKLSARVLWMGSLEAAPLFDPEDDWQLTNTLHSYQGSKYELELLSFELDKRALNPQHADVGTALGDLAGSHGEIRHLIVSPGVVQTNMSKTLNIKIPGYLFQARMLLGMLRFCGCTHIMSSLYAAAVGPVHVALAPLNSIPTPQNMPHVRPADTGYPPWHVYYGQTTSEAQMCRIGSESNRWGKERPGIVAVPVWEAYPNLSQTLLERFERLYQTFLQAYASNST
ncbi:hypothetical protein BD309DRAFT_959520 [Dichomitus squalens]|uniref:NAD(P)-binding protein n=1 Tax=Dichomitus squalens TaxID=114155 RepID=A0A4Q9ML52_9APHY|nr:hypothetical protein BD311DRAFT_722532 [Dichomitus squalens]TBU43929.1 hypothetical protein BD309DRAFT_959520 [Dichomitus squalens]TBU53724.1 hypothetical protein BD310DRAFT_937426 [Dichomitus squalens]